LRRETARRLSGSSSGSGIRAPATSSGITLAICSSSLARAGEMLGATPGRSFCIGLSLGGPRHPT
jgi:hypothetical protein